MRVVAIDKNKNETEYPSLEEAAQATNLSARTIKSRATNEGKTSKDGYTFRWANPATKKSLQAKRSKAKGNAWELEIIKHLNAIGYECVSSRSESKRLDDNKIDIVDIKGNLPVYIQAKNTVNMPNYYNIENECPLKDKPFCIAYKKAYNDGTLSPEPLAIIPLNYFYQLISK